jgi:predicted MPP superfamily phosphohydrolase
MSKYGYAYWMQNQVRGMLVFLSVFIVMMALVSFYIVSFYGLFFSWSSTKIAIVTVFTSLASLSYIIGEILSRRFGFFFLKYISALFLGFICISVAAVSLGYAAGFLVSKPGLLGLLVFISSLGLTLMAIINELRDPVVRRLILKIKNQELKGRSLKVVQLSDIHLNGIKPLWRTKRLVKQVNQLNPDVIVITGDLIDTKKQYIQAHIDALKELKAAYKFAVSGNHDFYATYSEYEETLCDMGFVNLDHNFLEINEDYLKEPVVFIGLPDEMHPQNSLEFLNKILSQNQREKPVVVLRHQPEEFEESTYLGVNLQLSGHTHNGQLPPFNLLVKLRYKYVYGLHRYKNSYIYTSKGTSTWGPPMRLFSPSELIYFELE